MKINIKKFNELVDQKYLSVQKHPTGNLLIWNYTQKCQYEGNWTEETMMARGLITDLEGNIVARPFKKFFNYEEHMGEDSKLPKIPLEEFEVFDKLDGSLGILYWIGDEPFIATRGSFNSDQAIVGSRLFREQLNVTDINLFKKEYTYLFEIIYPTNRIVVDYGQTESLFLLAVIDTKTGEDIGIYDLAGYLPTVAVFNNLTSISKIKEFKRDNAEGFVIRFKSGMRIKLKYEEYVRLHRLITGVTARTIWDLLRHKQDMDELFERVPEEFRSWVLKTSSDLISDYTDLEMKAKSIFEKVRKLPTRKEQAIAISKKAGNLSGIVFSMLDGRDYSEKLWKFLKPKAEKPFREDEA